jgi:hypothetical protein
LGSPVPIKPTKKINQNCIFGGKNWTCKMWLQVSKSLKYLILMKTTLEVLVRSTPYLQPLFSMTN